MKSAIDMKLRPGLAMDREGSGDVASWGEHLTRILSAEITDVKRVVVVVVM